MPGTMSERTTAENPIMKYDEVVELFKKISKRTLTRWINQGLIQPIEGTRRFRRADVEEFAGLRAEPKTAEQRKRGRYGRGKK